MAREADGQPFVGKNGGLRMLADLLGIGLGKTGEGREQDIIGNGGG